MKIADELARQAPERDSVLTVGVFDGVHRGHQHLLAHLVASAARTSRIAGVVTFRNHPASVLKPDFKPCYITTLEERVRLLRQAGVDLVVPVTFDLELSRLRVRDFVALLMEHLRMRGLVIGPDFAMGHKREGDARLLAELGRELGFSVEVVNPLTDAGVTVKSTAIRQAIARGQMDWAASMLGRSFVLKGTVVRGLGRGRKLGYPTANIEVPQGMAVPGDGIYATWAWVDGRRHMAATSIGTRPTFSEGIRTIEAYILDFSGDLYHKEVGLEFVHRLRDELAFSSVEALLEQIARDVKATRQALGASQM